MGSVVVVIVVLAVVVNVVAQLNLFTHMKKGTIYKAPTLISRDNV